MRTAEKYIFWAPRVLTILLICFLALFSLDVFEIPSPSVWMTIGGFLMHNIPSFLLAAILAVAWRRELVGALAFGIVGLLFVILSIVSLMQGPFAANPAGLVFGVPAFLIAALFFAGWRRKRR